MPRDLNFEKFPIQRKTKNLETEFQVTNKMENYKNALYTGIPCFFQRLGYLFFHVMQINDFRLNHYESEM